MFADGVTAPTGVGLSVTLSSGRNVSAPTVYALHPPPGAMQVLTTSYRSPVEVSDAGKATYNQLNIATNYQLTAQAVFTTTQTCTIVFALVGGAQSFAPAVFSLPYNYADGTRFPQPQTVNGLTITFTSDAIQAVTFTVSGAVLPFTNPSALAPEQCAALYGPTCGVDVCTTLAPVTQVGCDSAFPCPALVVPPPVSCPALAPDTKKTTSAALIGVSAVAGIAAATIIVLLAIWFGHFRKQCMQVTSGSAGGY